MKKLFILLICSSFLATIGTGQTNGAVTPPPSGFIYPHTLLSVSFSGTEGTNFLEIKNTNR